MDGNCDSSGEARGPPPRAKHSIRLLTGAPQAGAAFLDDLHGGREGQSEMR